MEHIIPVVGGGSDDLKNLAFSCSGCNNYTGRS
ncbi:MAG: HNH endonuclease [Bacteroidetes Order II. Incertae sedis bacterium]|nr:HNH endonuclease [Bacteroidetes Order II. bacterium]